MSEGAEAGMKVLRSVTIKAVADHLRHATRAVESRTLNERALATPEALIALVNVGLLIHDDLEAICRAVWRERDPE